MKSTDEFKKEIFNWSQEIGVFPKEIQLRKMKRKWASCSTRGRLTFSPELLKEEERLIHEVIVHELLHLKYPNHGEMFQALLKTHLNKKNLGDIRAYKSCGTIRD